MKKKTKKKLQEATAKATSIWPLVWASIIQLSSVVVGKLPLRLLLSLGLMIASFFGWTTLKDKDYWAGRAADLRLQLDQRANMVITRDRIIIKWRTKDGEGSSSTYIPPEGPGGTVTIPTDPNKPPVITVKKMGFCAVPGMGALYAHSAFQPVVDMKWAYFQRYGATTGIASKGLNLGISRHLDDVPVALGLKWPKLPNLEAYGAYQWSWEELGLKDGDSEGFNIGGGLRLNF